MSDEIQTITHSKSGASCRVHPFGATVISYKSADGRENLFLSRDAKLDGSKAVRGGIPLVFPIFGPPPADSGSTMPQHGFARVNGWKVKPDSLHDKEEHAGITFTLDLSDTAAGRGEKNPWSSDQAKLDGTACRLSYEIIVTGNTLTTTLVVENSGTDSFNFQMLLHTYCAVDGGDAQDNDQCYVHGLGGCSIIDKVKPDNSGSTQSYDDDVVLSGETDRVYVHPEGKNTLNVTVGVGNGKKIKLEAFGEVDETPAPVSCVVWNPGKDKAASMSDFGNDQYEDMICVEPGLIGHQALVAPAKQARLTQILYAAE